MQVLQKRCMQAATQRVSLMMPVVEGAGPRAKGMSTIQQGSPGEARARELLGPTVGQAAATHRSRCRTWCALSGC